MGCWYAQENHVYLKCFQPIIRIIKHISKSKYIVFRQASQKTAQKLPLSLGPPLPTVPSPDSHMNVQSQKATHPPPPHSAHYRACPSWLNKPISYKEKEKSQLQWQSASHSCPPLCTCLWRPPIQWTEKNFVAWGNIRLHIVNLKEDGEASKMSHAGLAKSIDDVAGQKLVHYPDLRLLL